MKKLLLLLMTTLLPMVVSADPVEISGIWYNLDSNVKQAEVTSNPNLQIKYTGSLEIPSSVTYEGTEYSVTGIGEKAFLYSGSLTSVTIPNSVTSIGDLAFCGCSGFISITIPNSVTSIGSGALLYCYGLESISVESGNAYYDSRNNCNALIRTSDNILLAGCNKTSIPDGVTSIGEYAFGKCQGLLTVTIPNSVTSIGDHAFYYCTGLTSITIPNSVTSIGGYAFYNCSGLTSITIHNSVTSIGGVAFFECSSLTKVIVSDIAAWCEISFEDSFSNPLEFAHHLYSDENTEITHLIIPDGVTSIGEMAFRGCSGLTSVTIPNSVTRIGGGAFYCSGLTKVIVSDIAAWCKISFGGNSANPIEQARHLYSDENTEITHLVIPDGVTSIGKMAFRGCSGLTSATIANSVTSIGSYAFQSCTGLTSIDIPNSVTSIGDMTFCGCSGLSSVTIPNSMTNIGSFAFWACNSLVSIVSNMKNPCPIDSGCFDDDVFNNSTLFVPNATTDKYRTTDYWNKFVHIEEGAPSGIKALNCGEGESSYEVERYDARGTRFNGIKKGLNIVKMSDGKTKKIVVK